jgi:hypothetical protein
MKTYLITAILAFTTSVMAKEIKTEIHINATPQQVWMVLTNFSEYPQWNPFIKSLSGTPAVGQKIVVRIEPPQAKGMTFNPVVLRYEPNKEFRWKGKLWFKGLFDGEHIFELMDNGDGTTTLIQREQFTGILVPMFKKMLDVNTVNGFTMMNQKLKELAEK